MPTFRVFEKYYQWAITDIVADSEEDARRIASEDDGSINWEYETEYDYLIERNVDKIDNLPPLSKIVLDTNE